MTIQQSLIGLGNNPKFVGYTMTSSSINETLTFNYPNCNDGDLIIAYIVVENIEIPVIPNGWNVLYSNTITATGGSNSARLLMFRKKPIGETNTTITVSGGGNATCVALRGMSNNFSSITEWVANTSTVQFANTDVGSKQIWIALFNQDGAVSNASISVSNTTATYSYSPGDTRSMAIGYLTGKASSKKNYFTIDSENAYGMTLIIT